MSSAREGKTSSSEVYEQLEKELKEKQRELEAQKAIVKGLKERKAEKTEISVAVAKLQLLDEEVVKLTKHWRAADPSKLHLDRKAFEEIMLGRGFIIPSFEIYGGVAGLYDLGPPLCAIKSNLLNLWRQHFVLEENILEVDTTCLTPSIVFKHSGHEKRFFDYMVKDVATHTPYRCDKMIEEFIETQLSKPDLPEAVRDEFTAVVGMLDDLGPQGMQALIEKHKILSPEGHPVSEPFPFNLMFATEIGPTGNNRGYMRPETAQGIFVNFKRLLDFNGGKMPFGAATIGQAFRNEIAPRSGLLRVREFTLAEIEYFQNPKNTSYAKIASVKDVSLRLFTRERQESGEKPVDITVGEALETGLIQNELLAYFLGRIQLFLLECGILPDGLRFRQHLKNEMAHYASACFDAEILTSYGWIEVVGCADRSAYDLSAHEEGSKKDLKAYERFSEPVFSPAVKATVDKGKVGKVFKKDAKHVWAHIEVLENDYAKGMEAKKALEADGKYTFEVEGAQSLSLTADLLKLEEYERKVDGEHYIPSVVEPSFGVGRILYGILEHTYWCRENDEKRSVFSLPPKIAPFKCAVFPLSVNKEFEPFVSQIASDLIAANIANKVDDSGQAIGRRYARTDQLGVPFGITVDFRTTDEADRTVTLRERDSCTQIRVKIDEVAALMTALMNNKISWKEVRESGKYEEQVETASEKVGKK